MAKQTIGVGAAVNDGTGDSLRTAFTKTNDNFTELYTSVSNLQASDADLTAIGALAGTDGFLKKTAANTWALDTSTYLTSTDFGEGFSLTSTDKVVTNKLYSTNETEPNQHYRLELDTNGVVHLPDQSIINGATLKTVPGNYAGITAGPIGYDEDSWVWVDNDGAWISTKTSTDNYQWKFDNNGALTLPNDGKIRSNNNIIDILSINGNAYSELTQTSNTWGVYPGDDTTGPNNAYSWIGLNLESIEDPHFAIENRKASDGIIHRWTFDAAGALTLPEGSILGETANTIEITPPGAQVGQSLVIRPTSGNMTFTSSGFIVAGVSLTITLTSSQYSTASQEAFIYTISGATAEQLGLGSLSGEFAQANWVDDGGNAGHNEITIPIPALSDAATLTLTITDTSVYHNVSAYIFANNPFTVTDNGVSAIENSHIHLIAGDPTTVDLYLGDDDQYVKIEKNGGNVVIGTNNDTHNWTFDTDGRTTFPVATVPTHSYGVAGDHAGMLAFDASYIYYCTADYVDVSTAIWKRTEHGAGTW